MTITEVWDDIDLDQGNSSEGIKKFPLLILKAKPRGFSTVFNKINSYFPGMCG